MILVKPDTLIPHKFVENIGCGATSLIAEVAMLRQRSTTFGSFFGHVMIFLFVELDAASLVKLSHVFSEKAELLDPGAALTGCRG